MINKSKKDYAYTILEVTEIPEKLVNAVKAVDGVKRIRVIK